MSGVAGPSALAHRHRGSARHRLWRGLRHVIRTPKGSLTLILLLLIGVEARVEGVRLVGPGLVVAVAVATALDLALWRWLRRRWLLPGGALLTGLLIGGILGSYEPLFVPAVASLVAIASKHVLRTRSANVFNPAALGLVVVYHLFGSAQNWWGALPAIVPGAAGPLLAVTGAYVVYRVKKLPLVLAFLAAGFALFAGATLVVDPADVSDVFVAPDLLAIGFFACFILTDPPTSPTRDVPQLLVGLLVAVISVAMCVGVGTADYLLVGVLGGNLFEAARRWRDARRGAGARRRLA